MNQQNTNSLNFKQVFKKWQVFLEQKKEQNQIQNKIQNYLQCPIPPSGFASPPKFKQPQTNIQAYKKERELVLHKIRNQNKKKTLQIQDFDDSDIRHSAHSLEMIKNKALPPDLSKQTMTPDKRSIYKLPKYNFCPKEKRHKSLPNQNNYNQTLSTNEYMKKILKKLQKHSSEKEQKCLSLIKSNQNTDFKKYNESQPIKLFNSKTSFSVNKYKKYFSNKIKTMMDSNIKNSSSQIDKSKPKRSIEISPWQTHEEQS